MRKTSRLNLLTALVLCAVVSAPAEEMKLSDLYAICTSDAADQKTACRFYILGAFEAAQLIGASAQNADGTMREVKEKRFCVPENLSGASMELLVKRDMGQDLAVYPADRSMPAISFITSVVQIHFGCQNGK